MTVRFWTFTLAMWCNMLLAINIGNTNTELGLFNSDTLTEVFRTKTHPSQPTAHSNEKTENIISIFYKICQNHQINDIAIASVVPAATESVLEILKDIRLPAPFLITAKSCSFIKTTYHDPTKIGADRLCNVIAGYVRFGGPLVVVDIGTAVTLDVIDDKRTFLGGVIMPGPSTALKSLSKLTAQLPLVDLKFPDYPIGKTTEECLQIGVSWAWVDALDGLITRISDQLNVANAIVTGGLGELYAPFSRNFKQFIPNLTLHGVRLLFIEHQKTG